MLSFNLSSFDSQPERDAAYLQMLCSFSKSQPAFGFTPISTIRGDTVMAAQRGHPFTGPAVPHTGDQSAAAQSTGDRIIRADAHKHSYSIDDLAGCMSSAVAAPSARNADFCVRAALPVNDGDDLTCCSIYIDNNLFDQSPHNALLQARIGFRMAPHFLEVACQSLELLC